MYTSISFFLHLYNKILNVHLTKMLEIFFKQSIIFTII